MYARFIVAQAAHESDNFSSPIFESNNNPFGMKYARQKEARGEKNGYAYYDSLGEAVQDYKRLFKSYGIVVLNTLESFIRLLKKMRYFEAPIGEYLKGTNWFYYLYFPEGWQKVKPAGASGSW
jgi:flagellum-specific peptidoglycan hydrolase FlgJ